MWHKILEEGEEWSLVATLLIVIMPVIVPELFGWLKEQRADRISKLEARLDKAEKKIKRLTRERHAKARSTKQVTKPRSATRSREGQ